MSSSGSEDNENRREGDEQWKDGQHKCYRDNSITVGGRIKEQGNVIQKRNETEKRLNVNYRVENLGRVMGQFCEVKNKWVCEMGFEPLFWLVNNRLSRTLCYWLSMRVDVAMKSLLTCGGKEFPLSMVQVHWVLGLPIGTKKILTYEDGDDSLRSEAYVIWESFRTSSDSGISRSTLLKLVESEPLDEITFKQGFLMLALHDVLSPTTCYSRLSKSLMPAVTVAKDAKQYDWCSFILKNLLHAVHNFARRFYMEGFAIGCGGCTIFLAIVYLDHLARPPVDWGVWPRIKVWSRKEVNDAKSADRRDSGDFGKLGNKFYLSFVLWGSQIGPMNRICQSISIAKCGRDVGRQLL